MSEHESNATTITDKWNIVHRIKRQGDGWAMTICGEVADLSITWPKSRRPEQMCQWCHSGVPATSSDQLPADPYAMACPKCGSEPWVVCWTVRLRKDGEGEPSGGLINPHRERIQAYKEQHEQR